MEIKHHIARYGVRPAKIGTAAGFSSRNLAYRQATFSKDTEAFLQSHDAVVFCYVSFRPEYRLEVLREGMRLFQQRHPHAGFVWLGFPDKELAAVRDYRANLAPGEKASLLLLLLLLLLGSLSHDEFLTLLMRCTAKLRTPGCDGVSASVLESLALGVPVVASENGRRPLGVIKYAEMDPADMCSKLEYLLQNYTAIKQQIQLEDSQDNVAHTADWLLSGPSDNSAGS